MPTIIPLTDPLKTFDETLLKGDIETIQKQGFSNAFIRRRIVFFQDGYRYAHDAAQKRWGFRFSFYEGGHEPTKRVYQSANLNPDGAAIWLAQMEKDSAFGPSLVKELQGIIEMEKKLAESIPKLPLNREGVKEAIEMHFNLWIPFFELAFLWFGVDPLKEAIDKKIETEWKGTKDELEYFLEHVYRPMQFPMSSIEQRDLLSLSQLKGGELETALNAHLAKYRHLSLHNIDDEYFDIEYYRGRVKILQDSGEYIAQKKMLADADEEIELANKLLTEANMSNTSKQRVEFVRWFMYLRTESVDHIMLVNSVYKPIFEFIAKEFSLPIDAALNMTYKEIVDSLSSGKLTVPAEEVLKRTKDGYAYLIAPDHAVLVTGNDIEKIHAVCFPNAKKEDVKELKGQIAFKGYAKGKARVILDRKEAHTLLEGEILVTTMTSPDFVPAMKISGAIVTNEGGVLCHAAIMSRELRRPCVISTKIATDVIKTGDMVEVDADKGIVTILA